MPNPDEPSPQQSIARIQPGFVRGSLEPQPQTPSGGSGWKKSLGPLAVIGMLILKFGAKLKFIIVPILKFFPLLLKTGGSMLITIGIYATLWGWKWAFGFVVLIFVHEMGHVFAARKYGVAASAPMFIPFMGAFIALKSAPRNAYVEAEIGIAGPIWGSAGAALCHAAGIAWDMPLLVALAWTGYWLNLFNLTPIGQLDGGHVVQAISPWLSLIGAVVMGYIAFTRPNFIIWIILFLSLPRIFSLFRKRTPDQERYLSEVTPAQRLRMAVIYFGLIAGLVWQMHAANEFLRPHHGQ